MQRFIGQTPIPPRLWDVDLGRRSVAGLGLILMVGLADWLFWGLDAGLSLAVFGGVLLAGAAFFCRARLSRGDAGVAAALYLVSVVPVVEEVQLLSRLFYWLGLMISAVWIGVGGRAGWSTLLTGCWRLILSAPAVILGDLRAGSAGLPVGRDWQAGVMRLALSWGLPLSLGGLFLTLLVSANPIAEGWILELDLTWLIEGLNPLRIAFWSAMTALIWPFLRLTGLAQRLRQRLSVTLVLPGRSRFLNPTAVRNSLMLFNALFAVQTAMDLSYLWGGAALPEGMTLAEYAHRGAYPLVATALLAGVFALISRPFTDAGWMRGLLYLWLAQNILLVASSLYRLDLYIGVFGLTYLRVAALIWMGLVAIGLGTVIWQVARGRSNLWLLSVNAALLTITLYAASLMNFAHIIAAHNLDPGFAGEIDVAYLCGLPKGAYPVIHAYESATGNEIWPGGVAAQAPEIEDWREWGFRTWRVERYFQPKIAREVQWPSAY